MTKEEELFYTLVDCSDRSLLSVEESNIIDCNRLSMSESYISLRSKMSFAQAYKESAIPVINKILKAGVAQHTTNAS